MDTVYAAQMPYHRPNLVAGPGGKTQPTSTSLNGTSRLDLLLKSLEDALSAKYAFDIFAPNSINFGILVSYRQAWEPINYQVGELVSTIPLAPKEMRRYTTKTVVKKTRSEKELEDALTIRRSESTETARVDKEIVSKALNKTNFSVTAHESIGGKETPYTIESTQTAGGEQSKESKQTKKEFHETVLKSSEEYHQQHRTEIDTSLTEETETTAFHEIENPNDELSVTYLFYELQRTYRVSEKLHKLTPVIFVANDVPAPHEIDDAWLIEHDWVLRRVVLDDSFRTALDYLKTSFVGAEINLKVLEDNATLQKNLVDRLSQQLELENGLLTVAQQQVRDAVLSSAVSKEQQGIFDVIRSVFDPIQIGGKTDTGTVSAAETLLEYARDTLDRAEKEKRRLESQQEVAVTALQAAIDKFAAAVKEHYDRLMEVDRLRAHVKENILYYMQAIWSYEPPDQRFFRLYKLDVPVITANSVGVAVHVYENETLADTLAGTTSMSTSLPMPEVTLPTRKLVDVADIDNLLGFKGNYMIFPLKENNYLTLHMMQDYLEIGDDIVARDPDEFGNYTLDELQELAKCAYRRDSSGFKMHENELKQLMIDRLSSPRSESDLVITPTMSLYIEALVGTHPLLEDFKLIHRALDVKKVQAEVRHSELENIRLAGRALEGKYDDPDIDKKIVIETDNDNITLEPDGQ